MSNPLFAQAQNEHFWVAGRYDGKRIIVYFDTVHFKGTIPPDATRLAPPVAEGFFSQVELSESFITQLPRTPHAEQFALGDQYDLLPGNGTTETVTLTTLLGSQSDEEVGNDSFVGALGTVKGDGLMFTKNYYAIRRHAERQISRQAQTTYALSRFAHLLDEPVRLSAQLEVASLLNHAMGKTATDDQKRHAKNVSPALVVQAFELADGSLRYYAKAKWQWGRFESKQCYVLGAWIKPLPKLHIMAVQNRTSSCDVVRGLPDLLSVVDLGTGRTGIVVSVHGDDGAALSLVEYRDGVSIHDMLRLQTISVGE